MVHIYNKEHEEKRDKELKAIKFKTLRRSF